LLLAQLPFESIVVALNPDDCHWDSLTAHKQLSSLKTIHGGAQRSESVLNALKSIDAAPDDLVLVHDAVRPCVGKFEINKLIQSVITDNECKGGILATPISDTIKRVDERSNITKTLNREGLWSALTPQLFRYAALREAMESADNVKQSVTDEASAMERMGHNVKVIAGSSRNIKITHPDDLALAEMILKSRENV
ncbi:MAG: 2-C-methyl-D-erythritol 4-phosphate cytidylyltransferase, partial [Pseudohongiellaceae bacterium]